LFRLATSKVLHGERLGFMGKEASMVRQIVASVDEEAAGTSYSVMALSSALSRAGLDSAVMAVGRRPPMAGLEVYSQDLRNVPLVKRFMLSQALARAVDTAGANGAVLHAHGLWLMPNLYPAFTARRYHVPLVYSPHGMLGAEALAFSYTRKRIAWTLAQRKAMQSAQCFHATSDSEAEEIRRMGMRGPIAVISNGIDIEMGDPVIGGRTVLCLGRLHPKKGIDRLIVAWARVARNHEDWRLRIVGPSEVGYRAALEAKVQELRAPRVDFCGPLYGAEKWEAYRQAGLFVLPTLNENFGNVVSEALAVGVPVICTKGAPWQGLEMERCGWWVEQGPDAMAAALDEALALPDVVRAAMGVRGQVWMARDFNWDGIAARMAKVYAWCLGFGDRPAYVMAG
jgi:glycosyltransferase involved in cell wall biosynthesis